MNQLATLPQPHVYLDHGIAKTSSLDVASYFEKDHFNVLESIKNLDCSANFNALNFQAVKYTDPKGESRPMYTMTFSGFVRLVMGFTGSKAAAFKEAYINAFDAMAKDQLGSMAKLKDELLDTQRLLIQLQQSQMQAVKLEHPARSCRRLSDADRLEIYRLRMGGMLLKDIGLKVGRSFHSVRTILTRIRTGERAYIKDTYDAELSS